MLTATQIRHQFNVGYLDCQNILRVLRLAEARGQAGRWIKQDFERDPTWTDGLVIDRTAVIADIDSDALFMLYCDAHAAGLQRWRKETN